MVRRRDFLKWGGVSAAAGFWSMPTSSGQAERKDIFQRATFPIKITKVEPFIIRSPKDNVREEDLVIMPPIGAVTAGTGLWSRLDHASPSRSRQYQQTTLVKISTDQGIVGWGECHAPAAPRVHRTVISDLLAPIVMGQDPRNIEVLWEKMYSSQRLRGYGTGFYAESIAGIDLALWDILGKSVGLPVYQLLGGKYQDKVSTYIWIRGSSAIEFRESAVQALEQGYSVVKMGLPSGLDTEQYKWVLAVSEAVKSKGQVIVDSLGAFKLHEAIKIGKELDRLGNIGWWEDPLMPEDDSGYSMLSDTLDTAICKGEVFSNRFQCRDLFASKSVDITNIDLCRACGITESRRIAEIADIFGIVWTPHVSMGSIPYFAASIHLAAATPNFLIMENGGQSLGPLGNILTRKPLEFVPGHAIVPEQPGLGVEFDEKALAKVIID